MTSCTPISGEFQVTEDRSAKMVGCGERLRGRAEGLAKVREACCYLQNWLWSKQKVDVVGEEGGCGRRKGV